MPPEKAMDINKPGPQMPDPTSRPVISGHDSVAIDPMMVGNKSAQIVPSVAKQVKPISADMQPTSQPQQNTAPSPEQQTPTPAATTPTPQPQQNTANEQTVNNERYQELLKSKAYFLPIGKDASHKKSMISFGVAAGILCLLIVILLIAADADLIKLPFKLPFNLITNS